MRVFIDGYIFWIQKEGGISRYWSELLSAMACTDTSCQFYVYLRPYSATRLSEHSNVELLEMRTRLPIKAYNRIEGAVMSWQVRKIRPDIFHSTYYTRVSPRRTPSVVTVHDTTYELFPQYFPPQTDHLFAKKREVILSADRIIAVSHSTKRDILSVYDLPEDKIQVIHEGIDRRKFGPVQDEKLKTQFEERHALSKRYFLYVGRRGSYKNFRMLLRAFATSPCRHEFMLVAVGGESRLSAEEEKIIETEHLGEQVRFLGSLPTHELRLAYSGACAFIMPSLYEGFGLPVLEAMACGCPVLASNWSSLPEIVGDAGILFDPRDPDSIGSALDQVANAHIAMTLSLKGLKRAGLFSWNTAARQTIGVYETLANGRD